MNKLLSTANYLMGESYEEVDAALNELSMNESALSDTVEETQELRKSMQETKNQLPRQLKEQFSKLVKEDPRLIGVIENVINKNSELTEEEEEKLSENKTNLRILENKLNKMVKENGGEVLESIKQVVEGCKTKGKMNENAKQTNGKVIVVEYIDKNNYKKYIGKTVKVTGDVDLSYLGLRKIPINFTEVGGRFDCSENDLTSLKGAPIKVGHSFYCSDNNLNNLVGAPEKVGGNFYCSDNPLKSTKGKPKFIGGEFLCKMDENAKQTNGLVMETTDAQDLKKALNSIKFGMNVINSTTKLISGTKAKDFIKKVKLVVDTIDELQKEFASEFSGQLKESAMGDTVAYIDQKNYKKYIGKTVKVTGEVSLSDLGLTKIPINFTEVGGDFYCRNNKLTSLAGAPEKVGGGFDCSNSNLTSLKGAPKIVGDYFYSWNNKLTSLEGAPEKVGGDFDCSNNKLTTLKGAPKKVGGDFDCSNNPLKSTKGKPAVIGGTFKSN